MSGEKTDHMEARVSVAMCTYNGEAHLAEQLQSILQQSTAVQEVVICDDCSGDGTYALLQAYSRQYPGLIRLHRNPSRIGYARNFDQAISLCQGEVIFLSDQDDVWLPRKVEKTIEFLAANPQCGLVSVSALVTNEHLQPALCSPGKAPSSRACGAPLPTVAPSPCALL